MKKISIGIPTSSPYFHRKFMESFMKLKYPRDTEVIFHILEQYQIPFARNRIVQLALENKSDYIFFIDADMIFPPDSLIRLLNRNVDIVHALSFRRTTPHYPCIFNWNEKEKCYETIDYSKEDNDLISIDAAGSACTLIKTDVFKKLKVPWYYYKNHTFSSDLTFSSNAKDAGFNIWVDRTLKIGHLGEEIIVTEESYFKELSIDSKKQWNSQMKQHLATEKNNYWKNGKTK